MALLATLAGFSHLVAGFNNHQLAERVAALLDTPYTRRQATYDLRRLRRKALITRRPHTNRYDLTPRGQRVVVLFTKTHGRVLTPGLAAMDDTLPDEIAARSPLGLAWRRLQQTLDEFIDAGLAAA
jgi:predicted MarR family transcription regulator